jgi:hypothetical protein
VMWFSDIQLPSSILLSVALQPRGGLGSFVVSFLVHTQLDTQSVELL